MALKSKEKILEELVDEYAKEIERINMLVSRNNRVSIVRTLNDQEKQIDTQLKSQLGLLLDLVDIARKDYEAEAKPKKIEKSLSDIQ